MTWTQTASGRAFDLVNPSADDVNFERDIIPGLAKIARWTGSSQGPAFSVAQHCVIGAVAIHAETGRDDMAAAFLLHDAHEAYTGDIATPVAQAIAAYAALAALDRMKSPEGANETQSFVKDAIKLMKQRIDAAIHEAAGITFPWPEGVRRKVEEYDLRMAITERNHLLCRPPRPWHPSIETAEPLRLIGKIKPWSAMQAEDEYRKALKTFLPSALRRAA